MRELAGSLLVFGVQGLDLTIEEARHFKETRAGGLILFRRNFKSPEQCRKLLTDAENAAGRRLLVCADHEGGRVVRFREGFTLFPDNAAFGRAGREDWVGRQGSIEAAELRALGVDVSLGPVLDVLTDSYGAGILWRSYGSDPELVARLGRARLQGLQSGGVSACAKHFPGKGHALQDAHSGLPRVGSSLEEMRRTHLVPFSEAARSGVDFVMTSHPVYERIDPQCATFSERIVKGLLREELGFRGVVATDDLQMGAVGEVCPLGEAAQRAALAGHDLLLVCQEIEGQRLAFEGLLQALRSGRLGESRLADSAARVEALRAKRPLRFGAPVDTVRLTESQSFAREVARSAAAPVAARGSGPRRWRPHGEILIVLPRFSELARQMLIEEEMLAEADYARSLLDSFGLRGGVRVVGVEPKEAEVEDVLLNSRGRPVLVLCYDAHLHAGWRKILEGVQREAQAAVILLRDPFDSEFLEPGTPAATGFGFRTFQIEAALSRLLGRVE